MNIAFVGNFEQHKGSDVYCDIVMRFKNEHNWYIFGVVKDPDEMLKDISPYVAGVHRYHWGGLQGLLKKKRIDLVLILSLLPETFSLIFFEVIDAECAMIVSDLGFPAVAFPEYSHFVDLSSGFSGVVEAISDICQDTDKLDSMREQLKAFKTKRFPEIRRKTALKFECIEECMDTKEKVRGSL